MYKSGHCDDIDLFYSKVNLGSPMHLNGKNSKMELNGDKLAWTMQMVRKFICMKKMFLEGFLPLPRGYIHVYGTSIHASSSLKPLSQLKPNLMLSTGRKRECKFIQIDMVTYSRRPPWL